MERLWPYDATPLERIANRAGLDADELREWLRAEITKRLRQQAKRERVEVACRDCGEMTDVSPSYAEKLARGALAPPICLDCKSPARAAREDAEVDTFLELLGEQARELAVALAALR